MHNISFFSALRRYLPIRYKPHDVFNNQRDIADQVDTTDAVAVATEVTRIHTALYPGADASRLERTFSDIANIYHGNWPGLAACDTAYHDIQHVMDVTLAMARLLDGYERRNVNTPPLDADHFNLGVITALFHDVGYIREAGDVRALNGAEYTLTHVSRGAQFLLQYLPTLGMGDVAPIAADLIHFTGYERHTKEIRMPTLEYRMLGNLLGTADILAQMADRCYLEKCRDRLYPEFVTGGIARKKSASGLEQIIFASPEDLLSKTPDFYKGAMRRLTEDLENSMACAEVHFGGINRYLESINKNVHFASKLRAENDFSMLKRIPPDTLTRRGATRGVA